MLVMHCCSDTAGCTVFMQALESCVMVLSIVTCPAPNGWPKGFALKFD